VVITDSQNAGLENEHKTTLYAVTQTLLSTHDRRHRLLQVPIILYFTISGKEGKNSDEFIEK
jgi:hypothetical protein